MYTTPMLDDEVALYARARGWSISILDAGTARWCLPGLVAVRGVETDPLWHAVPRTHAWAAVVDVSGLVLCPNALDARATVARAVGWFQAGRPELAQEFGLVREWWLPGGVSFVIAERGASGPWATSRTEGRSDAAPVYDVPTSRLVAEVGHHTWYRAGLRQRLDAMGLAVCEEARRGRPLLWSRDALAIARAVATQGLAAA